MICGGDGSVGGEGSAGYDSRYGAGVGKDDGASGYGVYYASCECIGGRDVYKDAGTFDGAG